MEWLLLAATVAVLGLLWVVWLQSGAVRELEADHAGARERAQALAGTLADREETIEMLREEVKALQKARKIEGEQYMERAMKYEDRISELIRQNQNMAERIASLRQEGLPEGGDDFHVEEMEPDKPWSDDLRTFYEGVETAEAQEMVEEFIVARRDAGIDDEQIVRELEEM